MVLHIEGIFPKANRVWQVSSKSLTSTKDEGGEERQPEEGKLDEKRYSFASRASDSTKFLDVQAGPVYSSIRFFVLKDVSCYTFVSRNTSIYKGEQLLRPGTTNSTTTGINRVYPVYVLIVYASCVRSGLLDQDVSVRDSLARAFTRILLVAS